METKTKLFPNQDNPKSNLISWLPIALLWAGVIFLLIEYQFSDFKVIAGFILLLTSTILMYSKFEVGVKFAFGIICLAFIGVIKLFPLTFSLILETNLFKLTIVPSMMLFLGLHYVFNKIILKEFLFGMFNRTISEEEKFDESRKRIETYKTGFQKESSEELQKLSNNDNLVTEAILAAKEILQERKNQELPQ